MRSGATEYAGLFRPERDVRVDEGGRVGAEEGGDAGADRHHIAGHHAEPVRRCSHNVVLLDPAPEFRQPVHPLAGRASGDQRGVDRPDGGSDHPVRIDAGFMQRLVDADLVGAESAAALKNQHGLAEILHFPCKRRHPILPASRGQVLPVSRSGL